MLSVLKLVTGDLDFEARYYCKMRFWDELL